MVWFLSHLLEHWSPHVFPAKLHSQPHCYAWNCLRPPKGFYCLKINSKLLPKTPRSCRAGPCLPPHPTLWCTTCSAYSSQPSPACCCPSPPSSLGLSLPQGLCTCYYFCLILSSPSILHHFLKNTSPDYSKWNTTLVIPPPRSSFILSLLFLQCIILWIVLCVGLTTTH
jgi:hypothetical protein